MISCIEGRDYENTRISATALLDKSGFEDKNAATMPSNQSKQPNQSDPRLRDCDQELDKLAAIIDASDFDALMKSSNGEPRPDFLRTLFARHVQNCVRCQWVRERVKMKIIPELDDDGNVVD
ncbi:MAG: hypothetical protein AAB853_05395 [Patescibacteria group bacterium]